MSSLNHMHRFGKPPGDALCPALADTGIRVGDFVPGLVLRGTFNSLIPSPATSAGSHLNSCPLLTSPTPLTPLVYYLWDVLGEEGAKFHMSYLERTLVAGRGEKEGSRTKHSMGQDSVSVGIEVESFWD